jgi:hypothetical protein
MLKVLFYIFKKAIIIIPAIVITMGIIGYIFAPDEDPKNKPYHMTYKEKETLDMSKSKYRAQGPVETRDIAVRKVLGN